MSMRPEIKNLVDSVQKLTLSELQEFMEELSKSFGIDLSQLNSMQAGPAAGSAAGAGAAETKKKMSLFITTVPADKKVEAIKVVKTVLNLSLMDAKNMIEGVMNSGKAKIKEGEQDELKVISENLTAIGVAVSIE